MQAWSRDFFESLKATRERVASLESRIDQGFTRWGSGGNSAVRKSIGTSRTEGSAIASLRISDDLDQDKTALDRMERLSRAYSDFIRQSFPNNQGVPDALDAVCLDGLSLSQAAKRMHVSRSTVARLRDTALDFLDFKGASCFLR